MSEYVGSRDRAKQFRTMLKQSFPGVKFSVRCDTGTAWNWIAVKWEDGPTKEAVRELIGHLHKDLTIERKYSANTILQAAKLLEDHYPELEVFDRYDQINWHLSTWDLGYDINIGPKHIRTQTMYSTLNDIAEHYVLGGTERFSNAAERKAKQEQWQAAQAAELDVQTEEGDEVRYDGNTLPEQPGDKGRLLKGNVFTMPMRPGEKPHLEVQKTSPFEALFRAVPDDQPEEEDLTPREVVSKSPAGRPLPIFSVPALVMADTDGFRAGEVVWVGQTISTVLEQTERVLVARGDGMPLLPVTTKFIALI
jgi:hypothetical protein